MSDQKGVTLVELMIVLSIMAIIAAIALPSYRVLVQNNQLTTTSNQILGLVKMARSEAIKANRRAYVEVDESPAAGDPHLKIWVDADSDATEDTDELIHEYRVIYAEITLDAVHEGTSTSWKKFPFKPNGTANTPSGNVAYLRICDSRKEGRYIRVLTSGLVRSGKEGSCS